MVVTSIPPHLATLPEGWQDRLVPRVFASGVTAWFLELHDAAISKYARGEPRHRRWIRAGLQAKLLDIDTLQSRNWMAIMESDERARKLAALGEDTRWLEQPGAN